MIRIYRTMTSYFLNAYNDHPLYCRKKAEYTFAFLLLIIIYAVTVFAASTIITGFVHLNIIAFIFWLFVAGLMMFLIKTGHIEIAINIFIISTLIKTFDLISDPFGLWLFIYLSLHIFIIGAIHLKKYQLYVTAFSSYAILIYSSFLPQTSVLITDPGVMVSYRNSMFIGCGMFILCILYVSYLIDSEIRKTETLEIITNTDTLTGLKNRLAFNMHIKSLDTKASFALMILDLDHFKSVNDTYGHQTGDKVLKQFGKYLEKSIEEYGNAYRIGGEEFAIIMEDIDSQTVSLLGQAIINSCKSWDFEIDQQLTTSIGCKYVNKLWRASDFTLFYRQADGLLYRAKKNGRDQILMNSD